MLLQGDNQFLPSVYGIIEEAEDLGHPLFVATLELLLLQDYMVYQRVYNGIP